jgi:protein TonB
MTSRNIFASALLLTLLLCVVLRAQEASSPKEGAFHVGSTVSEPALIHKVEPEYTEAACQAKLEGTVSFQVTVKKDGSFEIVKVLKTLGMGLEQKAADAVKQWKMRPPTKEGKPVDINATVELTFKIIGHVCDRWSEH